jgi:hypothetical protein
MNPLFLNDVPEDAVPVTEWDGHSWLALAVTLIGVAYMIYIHKTTPKED